MPRSKDPRNYPQYMHDLVELMERAVPKLEFRMGHQEAKRMQHQFYAFVQALASKAEALARSKALAPEIKEQAIQDWSRKEDAARRYLVSIEQVAPEAYNLVFIQRDLDPRYTDVANQVEAMLAQSDARRASLGLGDMEERLTGKDGTAGFTSVAPTGQAAEFNRMAGTLDVEYKADPNMTEEEAYEIMHHEPPDPTDLTDLVTPSNQATEPEVPPTPETSSKKSPMAEAFEAAEKLREREKEALKTSENNS